MVCLHLHTGITYIARKRMIRTESLKSCNIKDCGIHILDYEWLHN